MDERDAVREAEVIIEEHALGRRILLSQLKTDPVVQEMLKRRVLKLLQERKGG